MSLRWIIVILLGIVMIGGLVSGAYASSVQRALTLPAAHANAQAPIVKATPGTARPVASATPAGTNTQTVPVNTIAHDTFQRTDQQLWGTAIDGRMWESDANNPQEGKSFSIQGGMGQITNTQGTVNAILGPVSSNAEVLTSMTVSRFAAGQVNFGAVLRWNDTNNWYKALLDGTHLSVIKHIKGVGTQIAAVPFVAQGGVSYTLRFRAIGAMLFAKAWPTGTTEPPQWMIVTSDTALTMGQGGIRVVVQNNVLIRVSSFLEITVDGGA